ncbi:hypothetical protein MA5S0422_2783 [Mycobacteroides abscessus 5S-0422]|uniref:Uncharacterized protein n=1 Tax=Mycobacteroides abscessus subsp. bolletii 1513 TaxID=1299321 RepID=X8DLU1_9MYCO|nr:hypothetical protein MA5S0304_1849 [Mycobacteroides abscessus 5S-0304]EIU12810.1 hypothetical protein MA5S0421_2101 [Mycobacteroides abscessus 5S-0421]EIU13412.1 hypothetical protein MA5S0422_2783 [Mycobacteroides abscessus 5S-0422]EIU22460.1 hypothetical protein MA5S0708_4869 [Mycobacteroides abscessus 5S-0708]EIU24939.1 hypothetical protein MA5S0817_5182 [Mycobacteroides abscessus 5S-0817]EIU30460.1 hypothetical protein MA5S1212_4569 [Mycobacteroides abscessus 5S-1212]EIU44585.1 hypothet
MVINLSHRCGGRLRYRQPPRAAHALALGDLSSIRYYTDR